jgi:Cellulase (glycosyl hydrolase family 5)/PA14 domain/Bacterial Ig domain/Bacterial Ig-like domain
MDLGLGSRTGGFLIWILAIYFGGLLGAATLDPAFVKTNGWDLRTQAGNGPAVALRGVNIGGWLVQESWMCPSTRNIPGGGVILEADIEQQLVSRFGVATKNSLIDTYQANWITAPDLDALQAMGINFVRLPFSFLTFMEAEDPSVALGAVAWKTPSVAFARLDWFVAQAAQRGIYVLLDMHEVQGKAIDPAVPVTFWNTPAYQDRAVAIWQQVAAHYAGNPWVIGYDLLNEPYGVPNDYYDRCLQAIRAMDPDHTIFVETWSWQNLPQLATYGWSNVVCSLHFYPASGASLGQTITDYLAGLRTIRDTQQASGKYVPIHIGEFYLNGGDAALWQQLIQGFNDLRVPWTKWTGKTHVMSGWGLYERAFDPAGALDVTVNTPDIYADSSAAIQTAWSAWTTPVHAAGSWNHLDLSNRSYIASPVVASETLSVPASGTLIVRDADLLANDRSLNPAADLALSEVATPQHGTWYPITGGRIYVAAPGFTGSETITYRVLDRTLNLASATTATLNLNVTQAVTGVAPYVRDDAYFANQDAALTVMADAVLANDGDVLGRPLTAIIETNPAHGMVTMTGDGAFRYVPAPGFTGTDAFTYRAVAGGTASDPATVTITVRAPAPSNSGGLLGAYANGNGFPVPVATQVDATLDFTWDGVSGPVTGVNATNFCVRWVGSLCAPVSGAYTLTTTSDDAIRVYLGGSTTPAIDDWGAHGAHAASTLVNLVAGTPLPIRIDYVQYGGGGVAQLTWTPPGGVPMVVPASALVPGTAMAVFPPPADIVIQGKPPVPAAPLVSGSGSPTPVVSGDSLPGVGITLLDANTQTVLATVTADAAGHWQWIASSLAPGTYAVVVTATNPAVNATSSASESTSVIVTAPPAPDPASANGSSGNKASAGGSSSGGCGLGSSSACVLALTLVLALRLRRSV